MSEEPRPIPGPVSAFTLTLVAWVSGAFVWSMLVIELGHWASLAVGMTLGFGVVGTLAARSIPEPADLRMGLRAFEPGLVPALLLLGPAVLITSEIDNWVRPLLPVLPTPESDAPAADLDPVVLRLGALEFGIAFVLLRPVLEEFFFRGVILQGLVAHLGRLRGVFATAILGAFASASFALPLGPDRAGSEAAQVLFLGVLLGIARLATGSVLASMLVAAWCAALGVLGASVRDTLVIPGFNVDGEHTPPAILALALLSVACGLLWLRRAEPPPEPGPPVRKPVELD